MWNQQQAIDLCKAVEAVSPDYGFHVALTGGLLYKEGDRKDCDILFYTIRSWCGMGDKIGLLSKLYELGIFINKDCGFCVKAYYHDKVLDMFFPEEEHGEYDEAI